MEPHPRVGVAAIIKDRDGRVVLGRRKGSHGAGHWQLPGGHLEFGEEILACAERETLEETGLKVHGSEIVAVTNDVFAESNKHYITLFVVCERDDEQQQPEVTHVPTYFTEQATWLTLRAEHGAPEVRGVVLETLGRGSQNGTKRPGG